MRVDQLQIVLRDEIGKEMRKLADRMAAGRAVDFAEYRQQVGRVQGLGDALEKIDGVFQKMYDDDES